MPLKFVLLIFLITQCSALTYAQEVNFDWVNSIGDTGNDLGSSIAVDNENNVVQCGFFSNSPRVVINGDSILLESGGLEDILLTKWTSEGELIWLNTYGGSEGDRPNQVIVDEAGDIYMVGNFGGEIIFDSTNTDFQFVSDGMNDVFIGKWNTHGDLIWVNQLAGDLDDSGSSITLDEEGSIYISGYFQGTTDFDPGAGNAVLTSNDSKNTYVLKLNSSGEFIWVKQIGGKFDNEGSSILSNSNEDIIVTGNFKDSIDTNPNTGEEWLIESSISGSAFIISLSKDGEFIWSGQFSTEWEVNNTSTAVDADGNIILTGFFRSMADFDPGANSFNLTASGVSGDIFVTKLNSNGDFLWAKQMGGLRHDVAVSITTDDEGSIYTTGCYQSVADFDPDSGEFNLFAEGVNDDDIFISKLSSVGEFNWARSMNSFSRDIGISIAVDTLGSVYTTGVYGSSLVYETFPDTLSVVSNGSEEMFICKLSPELSMSTYSIDHPDKPILYPNPAASTLNVIGGFNEPTHYIIIDALGKVVKEANCTHDFIDISDLAIGQYFIQLKSKQKMTTSKFIKL